MKMSSPHGPDNKRNKHKRSRKARPRKLIPTEYLEYLPSLENYTPVITDKVISHYITVAGFHTSDKRVVRLISLAVQKYLSDVTKDAKENWQERNPNESSNENAKVLSMEDLTRALAKRGIQAGGEPAHYVWDYDKFFNLPKNN